MNLHIEPTDEEKGTPLPTQTGFKVWRRLPYSIAGLFVVLLTWDSNVIAYVGPFVGFLAVMDLIWLVFRVAHLYSADYWDTIRKDDN